MQNDGDILEIILLYFTVKLPISPVISLCHVAWHMASLLDSSQNFNLPYPWKSLCGWLSFNMKAKEGYTLTYCTIYRLFGTTGYRAACAKLIPAFKMVMRARNNNLYHLEFFACQQCNHWSVLPSLNTFESY